MRSVIVEHSKSFPLILLLTFPSCPSNNHQFAVLEPNCQKSAHVLRMILTGRQECNRCHRGFQDQWSDTSKLANSKRGLTEFFPPWSTLLPPSLPCTDTSSCLVTPSASTPQT